MGIIRGRIAASTALPNAFRSRLSDYLTGSSSEDPSEFAAWTRSGEIDGVVLAEVLSVGRPSIRQRVFRDCHFRGWDFGDVSASNCEFRSCIFSQCQWCYGRFGGCPIQKCSFERSDLDNVTFECAECGPSNVEDTMLSKCKMRGMMLHRSTWRNCSWIDCNTTSVECDAPRLFNLKVQGRFHQVFLRGELYPPLQPLFSNASQVDSVYQIDLTDAYVSDATIFPPATLEQVTPPADGHCVVIASRSAARLKLIELLGKYPNREVAAVLPSLNIIFADHYSEWALLTKRDLFQPKHLSNPVVEEVWQLLKQLAYHK